MVDQFIMKIVQLYYFLAINLCTFITKQCHRFSQWIAIKKETPQNSRNEGAKYGSLVSS